MAPKFVSKFVANQLFFQVDDNSKDGSVEEVAKLQKVHNLVLGTVLFILSLVTLAIENAISIASASCNRRGSPSESSSAQTSEDCPARCAMLYRPSPIHFQPFRITLYSSSIALRYRPSPFQLFPATLLRILLLGTFHNVTPSPLQASSA